jgi:hypothetical protein
MASFVLIPRAGGMAWYWHRAVPLTRAAGHEAIAVDLPSNDARAGLEAYADIVIGAIAKTKRSCSRRSVASGIHGAVCLRAGAHAVARVRQCDDTEARRNGWRMVGRNRSGRRTERSRDALRVFDGIRRRDLFPARAAGRTALGPQQPREEAETVFGEPCRFERWPDVPIHVLAGRDDRFFPVEFQRRVACEKLGKEVEEIAAVISSRCRMQKA